MKTIFIPIFQGVEAKNILRTDIYRNLMASKDVRLVLFVKSQERADYYKNEFNDERLAYEVIEKPSRSFWDRFFGELKFKLIKTKTIDLRRRMKLQEDKNYLSFTLNWFFNRIFANKLTRKLVRRLDLWLVKDRPVKDYFDKYRPDLVVAAHLFDDIEIDFVREAKRRGIRTLGFINSWDKLTARCMIRLLPDKMIVYNNVVKNEALKYADTKESNIIVTGIPQYDIHTNKKPVARDEFFAKKGLDPGKKLIVYAPMGKTFSNTDWDIIDLLRGKISSGEIKNAQLLVRFQPNDFFDEEEFKKRPGLVYDWPGIRFSSKRGVDWDMSFVDIKHLTDTLANMDILVCYASSMSVDAAVFDRPVININFEINKQELWSKSPTYFYKMEHYGKALASGGIRMVNSKEELIEQINKYLANPELDKDGRSRLVFEQCWELDGKAGERIAATILRELELYSTNSKA